MKKIYFYSLVLFCQICPSLTYPMLRVQVQPDRVPGGEITLAGEDTEYCLLQGIDTLMGLASKGQSGRSPAKRPAGYQVVRCDTSQFRSLDFQSIRDANDGFNTWNEMFQSVSPSILSLEGYEYILMRFSEIRGKFTPHCFTVNPRVMIEIYRGLEAWIPSLGQEALGRRTSFVSSVFSSFADLMERPHTRFAQQLLRLLDDETIRGGMKASSLSELLWALARLGFTRADFNLSGYDLLKALNLQMAYLGDRFHPTSNELSTYAYALALIHRSQMTRLDEAFISDSSDVAFESVIHALAKDLAPGVVTPSATPARRVLMRRPPGQDTSSGSPKREKSLNEKRKLAIFSKIHAVDQFVQFSTGRSWFESLLPEYRKFFEVEMGQIRHLACLNAQERAQDHRRTGLERLVEIEITDFFLNECPGVDLKIEREVFHPELLSSPDLQLTAPLGPCLAVEADGPFHFLRRFNGENGFDCMKNPTDDFRDIILERKGLEVVRYKKSESDWSPAAVGGDSGAPLFDVTPHPRQTQFYQSAKRSSIEQKRQRNKEVFERRQASIKANLTSPKKMGITVGAGSFGFLAEVDDE